MTKTPGIFSLILGSIVLLGGIYFAVTQGNPVLLGAGIALFVGGFMCVAMKNDALDIILGTVTVILACVYLLHLFASRGAHHA